MNDNNIFKKAKYNRVDIGDGVPVDVAECPMCGISPSNVDDCGEFGNYDCPYFGIGSDQKNNQQDNGEF